MPRRDSDGMSASTAKCKIVVKSPPLLRLLLPTNYMIKRTEKMSGMKIRHFVDISCLLLHKHYMRGL
jgi:hypothetical protein